MIWRFELENSVPLAEYLMTQMLVNLHLIKSQFSVIPTAGNVQGPVGTFNEICNESLSKSKRADFP